MKNKRSTLNNERFYKYKYKSTNDRHRGTGSEFKVLSSPEQTERTTSSVDGVQIVYYLFI